MTVSCDDLLYVFTWCSLQLTIYQFQFTCGVHPAKYETLKARGAWGFFVSFSSKWVILCGKHLACIFFSQPYTQGGCQCHLHWDFFNRETEELMSQPDILTGTVSEDNGLCWVMCTVLSIATSNLIQCLNSYCWGTLNVWCVTDEKTDR